MAPADDNPWIIDAARRGDRVAWDQLYRRLYPKLRSFFRRRIDHDSVEDALNETMAKAIAGINGYTPGVAGFDGWVFGIARRVSADHHRRSARDQRQPTVAHHIDGNGPETCLPVDHSSDLQDEHARLRSLFARLATAEQEILELRVIAGLSTEQVAALLNRRPGAIRTSQSRALAHLRRLLEADRVNA